MMRTSESSDVVCGSVCLQSCVAHINIVHSDVYKDNMLIVFQVFFPMDQITEDLEFPTNDYGNFIELCICYHDDKRGLENIESPYSRHSYSSYSNLP